MTLTLLLSPTGGDHGGARGRHRLRSVPHLPVRGMLLPAGPGFAVLWACAAGLPFCGCVCCHQATHEQLIPHRSLSHGRKRGPLPKVGKVGGGLPGQGRLAPEDCFTPADLRVGSTVNILGRAFLIYDCDAATRAWYQVTACVGGKMGEGAGLAGVSAWPSPWGAGWSALRHVAGLGWTGEGITNLGVACLLCRSTWAMVPPSWRQSALRSRGGRRRSLRCRPGTASAARRTACRTASSWWGWCTGGERGGRQQPLGSVRCTGAAATSLLMVRAAALQVPKPPKKDQYRWQQLVSRGGRWGLESTQRTQSRWTTISQPASTCMASAGNILDFFVSLPPPASRQDNVVLRYEAVLEPSEGKQLIKIDTGRRWVGEDQSVVGSRGWMQMPAAHARLCTPAGAQPFQLGLPAAALL